MKAMILSNLCDMSQEGNPLRLVDLSEPEPQNTEIIVRVKAYGIRIQNLNAICF